MDQMDQVFPGTQLLRGAWGTSFPCLPTHREQELSRMASKEEAGVMGDAQLHLQRDVS